MTLQQSLQDEAKKTNALFEKLENTSDNAVKTRESVYGELSRELRLHAEIEQRDIIPALRRNDETRDLANETAKRNRELRARLDELDELPKNDPSFRQRIGGLRQLFQEQVRGERAAGRTLSNEQRQAVEDRVETRRAQAAEEQRAEDEQRREEARREAEHRKAAEARNRAAEQVADAAKRTAQDVANAASDRLHEGAVSVRQTSHRAAVGTAGAARRVREAAGDTVTGYRESLREGREDVRAIADAVRNFARVGSELRSVLGNGVKQSARNRFDMIRKVVRSPLQFGEVQREYAVATSRNRIEVVAELMQVVRSASTAAREPLQERLREVA
jgi:hypothetical protein